MANQPSKLWRRIGIATALLAVIAGVAAYSISAYDVRQDARHDMQLHIAEGLQAYSENNCAVAYKKLAPLRDNLDPQAIYILASMYLSECGVPAASERADDAVAISLLTQTANAGYVRAEVALADLYAGGVAGEDFDERDTKSLFWFRKAALKGNADALFALGNGYAYGSMHLPRNFMLAWAYYELAYARGSRQAIYLGGPNRRYFTNITQNQIDEACAIARAWRVGMALPTDSGSDPTDQ